MPLVCSQATDHRNALRVSLVDHAPLSPSSHRPLLCSRQVPFLHITADLFRQAAVESVCMRVPGCGSVCVCVCMLQINYLYRSCQGNEAKTGFVIVFVFDVPIYFMIILTTVCLADQLQREERKNIT